MSVFLLFIFYYSYQTDACLSVYFSDPCWVLLAFWWWHKYSTTFNHISFVYIYHQHATNGFQNSLSLNIFFYSILHFKYIYTNTKCYCFLNKGGCVYFYHPLQTGSTALFFASQQGHNDVVKLLFEFGASTEFQTKVCSRAWRHVSHSFTVLAVTETAVMLSSQAGIQRVSLREQK